MEIPKEIQFVFKDFNVIFNFLNYRYGPDRLLTPDQYEEMESNEDYILCHKYIHAIYNLNEMPEMHTPADRAELIKLRDDMYDKHYSSEVVIQ